MGHDGQGRADRAPEGSCDDRAAAPARHEQAGGDAVCWLERVCDRCGGLSDGPPEPVCERCGAALR